MRRIIIVVEGQTEQEFVKQCIAPYMFEKYGITSVAARLIGKPGHKGGDVRYERLKKDLTILLREPDVIVSTFVDFFRLPKDFPETNICNKYDDVDKQIDCLEQSLSKQTGSEMFIPYIQKYEFEALLFSSNTGFIKYFGAASCQELEKVSQQFPNPENINSNQPPSYRLIDVMNRCEPFSYKKVIYGNVLALSVGIDIMLARCQRFASWIDKLGKMASRDS